MTPLNRKIALENLRLAADSATLRRRQAEKYHRRLRPLGVVRGISEDSLPQSHFPICVAADRRAGVRKYLHTRGVDTGTFFPFPAGLRRAEYPNAARASDEVVLLPLGEVLRLEEVDTIVRHVEEALRAAGVMEISPN
jgi:dTDP-4-amino-4,6-dideoxygalactose transaminase